MSTMSTSRKALFPLLILCPLGILAGPTCYRSNGGLATSDIQACNSSLASGENGPCCNLGKVPPDVCLGGGLCQREDTNDANFLIYAVGCTDQTGKDPSCQQYCSGSTVDLLALQPCSNGRWCCNNLTTTGTSCCVNNEGGFSFNLQDLALSTSTSSTSSRTSAACTSTGVRSSDNSSQCPKDYSAAVGASVGGVLGASLIACLIALFCVVKRQNTQGSLAEPYSSFRPRAEMDATTAYRNPVAQGPGGIHEADGRGL